MKIACLAWGSLLWKTGPLQLSSPWHADGPRLPLEFCRVGDTGELATALCDGAELQQAWWAVLEAGSLGEAREQLRQREEIDPSHPEWVGSGPSEFQFLHWPVIQHWMAGKPLDAVVWTALPPRIDGVEGRAPTPAQAVRYLEALEGERRAHAEDYIRRMPAGFSTGNRQEIERQLGWNAR